MNTCLKHFMICPAETRSIILDIPDAATSLTGSCCSRAINPITEKMTNPAKRLVQLFRIDMDTASLKKEHSLTRQEVLLCVNDNLKLPPVDLTFLLVKNIEEEIMKIVRATKQWGKITVVITGVIKCKTNVTLFCLD